jgi:hypothetical protein
MVLAANTFRMTRDGSCSALAGHVVARIHGALGATILVGLDQLVVCRCDASRTDHPRQPWAYTKLRDAEIGQYGSLSVVVIRLADRGGALPILVLERDQVGGALDGLVTLRRLIAAAMAPDPTIDPKPERAAS